MSARPLKRLYHPFLAGIVQRPGLHVALVAAATLYLSSIFYGLPQELDPDEHIFFGCAIHLLQNKTLDPTWYGHPAQPLIYLLAIIIIFIAMIGILVGTFQTFADIGSYYLTDVSIFFAAGRMLNVSFALAAIWLTDRLIRHVGIIGHWRWISITILCLSPLWGKYASIVRSDMMQIFFVLAALHCCVQAAGRIDASRNLILSGACVGIAMTCKYPGIISAIPVGLCAALLVRDGLWSVRKAVNTLLRAALACVAAAFVTAPYLFLDPDNVLNAILTESRNTHLGHTGPGFAEQLTLYLTHALPEALSPLAVAFGLLGLVVAYRQSNAGKLIAALAVAYILFISSLSLLWARWTLPVLPLLVIGLAVGGQSLENVIRERLSVRRAGVLSSGICLLFFAPTVIDQTLPAAMARATNSDTRVQALTWVEENVPRGSHILTETYAPALSTAMFDLYIAHKEHELVEWKSRSSRLRPNGFYESFPTLWDGEVSTFRTALITHEIEYIVMSDSFYSRYQSDQDLRHIGLPFYQAIFEDYETIKTFEGAGGTLGPRVFILETRNEDIAE